MVEHSLQIPTGEEKATTISQTSEENKKVPFKYTIRGEICRLPHTLTTV